MKTESKGSIVREKLSPGFERTIAWLENVMVVACEFTGGPAAKPDPPHSHHHEQITYVAEGELYFFRGEEKLKLTRGDMVTIPPDVPHCIQTQSPRVVLIDSFSPIRNDFISK